MLMDGLVASAKQPLRRAHFFRDPTGWRLVKEDATGYN
jgi:hypothetical protein